MKKEEVLTKRIEKEFKIFFETISEEKISKLNARKINEIYIKMNIADCIRLNLYDIEIINSLLKLDTPLDDLYNYINTSEIGTYEFINDYIKCFKGV